MRRMKDKGDNIMTIEQRIAILEYRRDKLLKKGFYNHKLAAKIQRKIYALQQKEGNE